MKNSAFTLLLFSSVACFANDIDKLQTIQEVNIFFAKKLDKSYKKYPPLDEAPKVIDTTKYGRNKFFKLDFDGNGLTDLIVYSYRNLLLVTDNGKAGYSVHTLDNGTFLLNTVDLIAIDDSSVPRKIIVHQKEKPETQTDTLVFKFNSLIEFNSNSDIKFEFQEITLKTSRCFGTCPVFEMTIKKDRKAIYKAIEFNEESGNFISIIPTKEFDEMISLLRYLRFDSLSNEYRVNWTDDQTATTEIKYNGKVKTISDYGEIGTFGLVILYSKLFNWRRLIEWRE